MKKIIFYFFFLISVVVLWSGCKEGTYPGATISPYIPLYDLRNLYKGSDLTLTTENMFGSSKISGIVVSDHSGGNLPAGLLIVQDRRRLQQLRGIAIPLGSAAANYVSGDSVIIDVDGGLLKRADGLLQIFNISESDITKVSSGNFIPPNRVPSSFILADPEKYESTLVAIVKGGFDPLPKPADIYSGDKILNDGFADITLHTEGSAVFANNNGLPISANFYGIIFNKVDTEGKLVPEHRIRTANDVVVLSSEIEIAPIIIAGVMVDLEGGDGNYEYMQFLATEDINFEATPYSVVVTNNAGATSPTGLPSLGWATGSLATKTTNPASPINSRTYKFDLTSGFAAKGTFFYVGGSNKRINGPNSTLMTSSNWIKAKNYAQAYSTSSPKGGDGDGFGNYTSGLFANSGNASGFAVFKGTTVTANSAPIDVIMMKSSASSLGGSLFDSREPTKGYRIANNDFYDKVDPITLESQPFFMQGSNTLSFLHNSTSNQDLGLFFKFGGIYDQNLGKWKLARTQTSVDLSKTSTIEEIEGIFPVAGVDADGVEIKDVYPTRLKEQVIPTP